MSKPLASIVIRAKNEEACLSRTLRRIFDQTLQDFEVVLVDSGSTDRTLEIARRFPVRILEIRAATFTYGYALNHGASKARGEFLVNLSAHAVPCTREWLAELLRPFEGDFLAAAVYGRQLGRFDRNPFEAFELERFYGPHSRIQTSSHSFSNANSAIPRRIWEKRLFARDVVYAEDRLWAKQVLAEGLVIHYVPTAAVWHFHDESLRQIMHRQYLQNLVFFEHGLAEPKPVTVFGTLKAQIAILVRLLTRMISRRISVRWIHKGVAWYYGSWWGAFKARRETVGRK